MKRERSQKGVSTLIAAILLTATTLVISLIVTTSFTTLTKSQVSTIQTRTTEAVNCTSSNMEIQAVYIDAGSRNTTIAVVRNAGQIQENIISAQLLNKTGSTGALLTSLPLPVARGDIVQVAFNISGAVSSNITCANFDRIIITTQCIIATFSSNPTNC